MNKYLKLSFIFTGLYLLLFVVFSYPFLSQYLEIFNFFNFRFGIAEYMIFITIVLATIMGVVAIFKQEKKNQNGFLLLSLRV